MAILAVATVISIVGAEVVVANKPLVVTVAVVLLDSAALVAGASLERSTLHICSAWHGPRLVLAGGGAEVFQPRGDALLRLVVLAAAARSCTGAGWPLLPLQPPEAALGGAAGSCGRAPTARPTERPARGLRRRSCRAPVRLAALFLGLVVEGAGLRGVAVVALCNCMRVS